MVVRLPVSANLQYITLTMNREGGGLTSTKNLTSDNRD